MRVSFKLEPDDFDTFALFVHWGDVGVRLQRVFPWLLVLGCVAFLSIQLDVAHNPIAQPVPILLVGWFLWFRRRQRARTLRRGAALFALMTVTISESGISTEAEGRQSTTGWPQVRGFLRGTHHVFIMLDELAGHIVPVRAFADVQALDEFVSELRLHAKELPPPPVGRMTVRKVALWAVLIVVVVTAWYISRLQARH